MINKPTIIISSLGRTGTTFFAEFFNNNFENIFAVHEPEKINIKSLNFKNIIWTVKNFGFYDSFVRKAIDGGSLLALSNRLVSGRIGKEEAAKQFIKSRKKFIKNTSKEIYLESNYHFFGLLGVLDLIFDDYKAVYIIRDPRDWLRSWIDKKGIFDKSDIHYWLGNRISPQKANDIKFTKKWSKTSKFERLCWTWNYLNQFAISSADKNPNIRILKFEDLFVAENKNENMKKLISHLTSLKKAENFNDADIQKITLTKLEKKINAPQKYKYPKWENWGKNEVILLNEICGNLMEKFGYGGEISWINKLK